MFLLCLIFSAIFLLPTVLTITNSFMNESEITANYGMIFSSSGGFVSRSVNLKFIPDKVTLSQYVSGLIRTPEISMMASAVSAIPEVRAFLLDLQRDIAHTNNVIMDGRDIGTVVLPDAKIKIFLSASAECRARRRYDQLIAFSYSKRNDI